MSFLKYLNLTKNETQKYSYLIKNMENLMKLFLKKLTIRILTYIATLFVSVLFAVEILLDAIFLNFIYLIWGKSIEYCQFTMWINGLLDKSEWIE